jgi:hypothetical protein
VTGEARDHRRQQKGPEPTPSAPLSFNDPLLDFTSPETVVAADLETWYFAQVNHLVQRALERLISSPFGNKGRHALTLP